MTQPTAAAVRLEICISCIGDVFLSKAAKEEGHAGQCAYCRASDICVAIEWVAENVDAVVSERFHLTPSEPEGLDYLMVKEGCYWEREGEDPASLIERIARVPPDAAEDIRLHLEDSVYYDPKDSPAENHYAEEARFEEDPPAVEDFIESWDAFVRHVQTRSRFFSHEASKTLHEVFGNLSAHRTPRGKGVIRTLRPKGRASIYRARVAFSSAELKTILVAPERELGPPTPTSARAGRMNAGGIPVFYGALDPLTCIAEVRPPVGSHVVVGRFVLERQVCLLDLDAMRQVFADPSHFDPRYSERTGRAAFLRRLAVQIARPVMPSDEETEYLPTQVVAEYLAEVAKPRIDGMIYRSVQRDRKGRNVVLFNHVRNVRPRYLGREKSVDVSLGWESDDDYVDSITVFEGKEVGGHGARPNSVDKDVATDAEQWFLRLERESIVVHDVTAASVRTHRRSVSWHDTDSVESKWGSDDIPF